MGKHTALYTKHLESNASFTLLGDWEVPNHYHSATHEHLAVRQHAGMFDVSHMTIVDIRGIDAEAYLQKLLANNVSRLENTGQALYSTMLNNNGGIIDDVILYNMGNWYRIISNGHTRNQSIEWMTAHATGYEISLTERPELCLIAIQGPKAISCVKKLYPDAAELIDSLNRFEGKTLSHWFYSRTGYTGEDGLEITLPEEDAAELWQTLLDAGVVPCGLQAADSLRIEAGFNFYGKEMSEQESPLTSNMAHSIAWQPEDRAFLGRDALSAEQARGVDFKLVGLVLPQHAAASTGQALTDAENSGVITSATYSPSLNTNIAIARVPATTQDKCQVSIDGNLVSATVINLPFVRKGKKQF